MGIIDRISKKKSAQAPKIKDGVVVESSDKKGVTSMRAHSLIRCAVLSEKAVHEEARGTYTFVVENKANKTSVKQAVRDMYGVLPVAVRIVNVQGKRVRFGRNQGKRTDWKKAIVTLPKGKTISIHEGV